ncbi:hypothetical protein OROMI_022867 [Orobanche minor]
MLIDRAILTPNNDIVDDINDLVINKFPGPALDYYSTNITDDPFQQSYYQDYLNSIHTPGLPSHLLRLKTNDLIMLLWNINPSEGLCNGTCLICRHLGKNIISAEIVTGQHEGNSGNKVEAMLYGPDVDFLKNTFQPDETYLVSNALVRPVKQGFENPMVNNNYQWIIGARTAVLPTEKSFTPFVITFWNDAIPDDTYSMLDCVQNQHVIAALNFNVTKYHVQTLHTKDIIALLNKDKLHDRPHASLNINTHQTAPIHDILATTERQVITKQSEIHVSMLRSLPLFDICIIWLPLRMPFLPPQQNSNSKYRISLSVFYETGEIEVTMFGKDGEKLLNLHADDFWQKYQEDGNTILSYTVQLLDCQKIAPLPVCTDDSTEQPSSASGITYLIPAEINNPVENLITSTQAPPEIQKYPTQKSTFLKLLKMNFKPMSAYVYELVQTLIVNIKPDGHMKRAINETNAEIFVGLKIPRTSLVSELN